MPSAVFALPNCPAVVRTSSRPTIGKPGCCGCRSRRNGPCRPAQHGHDGADLGRLPFADPDLAELARSDGFHLDGDLVGLHLEQLVTQLDVIALFLEPGEDLPSATVSPSCGMMTVSLMA